MATSAIEQEIIKATGFEPRKNYDRPDYLAAVARHINEVEEDVYDGLSAEAQDWFNSAVKAINKKQDLPDFPDLQANSEDTNEEETSEESTETEEEPDPTDDNPEEDNPPPKKAGKANKKTAKAKEGTTQDKKAVKEKPATKKPGGEPVPGRKLSIPAAGDVDRYGVTVDSKGHAAILILEKGARMSDVTESIGGTYYNLLQRLVKQGHRVEKSANGLLQLIHKHDIERKTKSRK